MSKMGEARAPSLPLRNKNLVLVVEITLKKISKLSSALQFCLISGFFLTKMSLLPIILVLNSHS